MPVQNQPKYVTQDALKSAFASGKPSSKVELMVKRIRARLSDGIHNNLESWRIYSAIDDAYDAPPHEK